MDYHLPKHEHHCYHKWLRYYLDYDHKYHVTSRSIDTLTLFTDKLKSKHQTDHQVNQAIIAIKLNYITLGFPI